MVDVDPREGIKAVSRINFRHSDDSLKVLDALMRNVMLTSFADYGGAVSVMGEVNGRDVTIFSHADNQAKSNQPRYVIGSSHGAVDHNYPGILIHAVETPEGTKFKTTHKNITYRGLVKHPVLGTMLEKLKDLGIPHEIRASKQAKLLKRVD